MTEAPTSPAADVWRERLRSAGLRATGPRISALLYLQDHPHKDASAVLHGIEEAGGSVTLQGVHVLLRELAEHKLLRRVDLPDSGSARFETRIADNHHHLRCIECGVIEDVDCAIGAAPCLVPSDTHGMQIIAAEVTFQGICRDCQKKVTA